MKVTVVYADGCRYDADARMEDSNIVFTIPAGDVVGVIMPNGESLKFDSPISEEKAGLDEN